nr:MAG TPA: hypothetical protein [Caudoviricetes sp.]
MILLITLNRSDKFVCQWSKICRRANYFTNSFKVF